MSRLERLLRLTTIAPSDPMTHYGLGLEYIHLGRWSDAVAAFDTALAADPNYSAAYYHKARAQISAGLPADARATLTAGMDVAHAAGDWHTHAEMSALLDTIE